MYQTKNHKKILNHIKNKNLTELKKLHNSGISIKRDPLNFLTRMESPICLSLKLRSQEITKFLLENGADVDEIGLEKLAPIQIALKNQDIHTLKTILKHKPNQHVKHGTQPIIIAATQLFDEQFFKILLEHNFSLQPLWDLPHINLIRMAPNIVKIAMKCDANYPKFLDDFINHENDTFKFKEKDYDDNKKGYSNTTNSNT